MTPEDVTALDALLAFAQSIGVGFGDVVILLVLAGFFWLISKGKLKIGANGMGEDIKAIRSKVQDIDVRLGKVETKVDAIEQYRR